MDELQEFTIEEFQNDFDNLMERVEKGETFIIRSETGKVIILPYNEIVEIFGDTDSI